MKKCPRCNVARPYFLSDGRYKCRRCGHRFSWTSAWDSVRLKPASKGTLLDRFVLGVPAYRQRFTSGVSAKAMERFNRLLRSCCAAAEQVREPFEGAIECDESAFGGKWPGRRGRGAAGKVLVFGLIQRNGHVIATPIANASETNIMREIQAHTREGSLYYTDGFQAYVTLRMRGEHVVIRKEKGILIGRDHINGIEGFWSYAKTWLYPFRGVPRQYFHLYLGEVCYRFNHRNEDLRPLLYKLMKRTSIQDLNQILVRKG